MKEYLPLNQNDLVITNNQNYIINEGTNNILVKSGVVTNLLTYNNLDDVVLNLEVEKDAVVNVYQIVNTTKEMKLIEKVNLQDQGATVNSIVVLLGTLDSVIDSDIKIYHNNEIQIFKDVNGKAVYPISYNGTTYLPVRAISNLYNSKSFKYIRAVI